MPLQVDLFWSFRSPYSYLAMGRLIELRRDYDVDIAFRPVYPIAVRIEGFFQNAPPQWVTYLVMDCNREAERQGIPFRWPRPDPVVQDRATREVSEDQPYIHRLTRLGQLAAETGDGLAFADSVSRMLWSGMKGWDQGDHLAKAVAAVGFDLAAMDAAIEADPEKHDAGIKANEAAHERAGHWGVPTMAFKGEPFFGQDRIDALIWRLKQKGLKKRA
ncbi:MAG: 2-hydroxychromene-2-carboxylate isomerase [Alphaproteobacteria bacterium]